MQTTLTVNQVRGLLLVAAKSDVRFYLNGVYIDFADGRAIVTDGYSLIALNVESTGSGNAIIPRAALEAVSKGGKVADIITISVTDGIATIERETGLSATAPVIDGRFPNYWRVIPDNPSGELAQFNPELVARTAKALTMACEGPKSRPTTLAHNGNAAGLLFVLGYSDRAIAAVMPWRAEGSGAPEFLDFQNRGQEAAA